MESADSASEPGEPGHEEQDGIARLTAEIRLLVEMVVEQALPWLDEVLAAGHGTPHTGERPSEGAAAGDSQAACQWCPLCAVVAVARGQRPEFAVRLFEQAAQLVGLLRAVLADRWEPEGGVHMPGDRPADRPARDATEHTPRVQHIAVRRRDAEEHSNRGQSGVL